MKRSSQWDVLVIRSGMVTAAALSQLGHKVLMLEQHDKLGGPTHSFSRERFSCDAGLHYLVGFGPDASERAMLDELYDSPIELAPMGPVYDTLHFGDAAPMKLSRPASAQRMDLKKRFPKETEAIDEWFDANIDGRDAMVRTTRGAVRAAWIHQAIWTPIKMAPASRILLPVVNGRNGIANNEHQR